MSGGRGVAARLQCERYAISGGGIEMPGGIARQNIVRANDIFDQRPCPADLLGEPFHYEFAGQRARGGIASCRDMRPDRCFCSVVVAKGLTSANQTRASRDLRATGFAQHICTP